MDASDLELIRSMPMFEEVPETFIRDIFRDSLPKSYDKGYVLFEQGAPAEAFYVVLDGWVKLYRITSEGEEAVLAVFSRGETFAEAAMFIDGNYPVCAEVISSSRLLKISGQLLRNMIREQPELAFAMLASAYRHLKTLVEQIEYIKLLSAPRRVAQFLVQRCPRKEGACVIGLPYEKTLIANRLGMKPESLSRAIARLRCLGVRVDGEHVVIPDVAKLDHYVTTGEETAPGGMALRQGVD